WGPRRSMPCTRAAATSDFARLEITVVVGIERTQRRSSPSGGPPLASRNAAVIICIEGRHFTQARRQGQRLLLKQPNRPHHLRADGEANSRHLRTIHAFLSL